MQRRQFMRLGLFGSALVPAFVQGEMLGSESLHWLQLPDERALPLAGTGDWLGVDVTVDTWEGDGYYLYPAWGEPRPYQVRAVSPAAIGEAGLAFCDPATGRVLWSDTRQVRFAGRVRGRLPAQIEAWLGRRPELPLLQVPRLPT